MCLSVVPRSSGVRRRVGGVLVIGALFASWWTVGYLRHKATEIKEAQEALARRHQQIQDSIAQFASGYSAVLDWRKALRGEDPLDVAHVARVLVRPDGRPIVFVHWGGPDVIQVPGENSHLCYFNIPASSHSSLQLILSCGPELVRAAQDSTNITPEAFEENERRPLGGFAHTPSPMNSLLVAARIIAVEDTSPAGSSGTSFRATGFCLGHAYPQEKPESEYFEDDVESPLGPWYRPDTTPSVLGSLVVDLWEETIFKVFAIIVLVIVALCVAGFVMTEKPKWLGYPDPQHIGAVSSAFAAFWCCLGWGFTRSTDACIVEPALIPTVGPIFCGVASSADPGAPSA